MNYESNLNQEENILKNNEMEKKEEINLIDAYIGVNSEKLKDGSFSWCTLIFGPLYVFYRKMWLFGFVWFLIISVITLLAALFSINFSSILPIIDYGNYSAANILTFVITWIVNIVMSFMFKKLYIKKVTKKVEQIKQKNIGASNEELSKICSKKGGTTILGIILAIALVEIIPTLLATVIEHKLLIDVNEKVEESSAYSIISSVENAYTLAELNSKDGNITLESIKAEYDGKFSTWNEDNTISSNSYDFVCNITVNENNEMQVSCDVNGKIIESELFSLGKSNTENDKEESNAISYRIEEELADYGTNLYYKHLYVNDKLVNFMDDISSVKVQQMADILIVERSLSSKVLFVVDKNANVIGVFGSKHGENDKNFELLKTKLYYRDTYRIDGNNIYVQTDQLGNGGADYTLCHNIIDDNEIVVYEEKFTYLGNNKFSNATVTKQVTRKQYMQEHNITCNTKELLKEKDLLINKTSSIINFYKNNKKIGTYFCKGMECSIIQPTMDFHYTFYREPSKIYESGKVALTDNLNGNINIVIFDIYNNRTYDVHEKLADSYNLGDKYMLVKNKDNQFAILNKDYEYVKKYSNKQFLYSSGYVGNNNFNVEKDMIISIKDNLYGIEKISKNEMIINHKYANIALTDGITVYSTNDNHEQDFYYTDKLYQNKYFKGKIGNKWYLYDLNTDKKVINKGYDRLYLIDKNTIAVYENGKISFIDYKGNYVTDDKIEVYVSSEKFYQSPEGIRFILNGNIVNIYVDIEKSSQQHHYEYNLKTKKITKIN